MTVLGICDSHEAAAYLFVGGRLIAACAEERFTRLMTVEQMRVLAIRSPFARSDVHSEPIAGRPRMLAVLYKS